MLCKACLTVSTSTSNTYTCTYDGPQNWMYLLMPANCCESSTCCCIVPNTGQHLLSIHM
jgi:hypothetical protein